MDAQTIIAAIVATLAVGGSIVGIAMYAGKSRDVADDALHKARNVETAHAGHVAFVDRTYMRKETIEPQLKHIAESVKRIEDRQSVLFDRLMGTGQ